MNAIFTLVALLSTLLSCQAGLRMIRNKALQIQVELPRIV